MSEFTPSPRDATEILLDACVMAALAGVVYLLGVTLIRWWA